MEGNPDEDVAGEEMVDVAEDAGEGMKGTAIMLISILCASKMGRLSMFTLPFILMAVRGPSFLMKHKRDYLLRGPSTSVPSWIAVLLL